MAHGSSDKSVSIHDYLLHVNHGTASFDVSLSSTSTIGDLKHRLYELTSVPVDKQKLLWKGMKRGAILLEGSGLKNGSKVTLVGASGDAIQSMHQAEAEASRRAEIMRNREACGPTKVSKIAYPFVESGLIVTLAAGYFKAKCKRRAVSVPPH
jgi:hypothetical protein